MSRIGRSLRRIPGIDHGSGVLCVAQPRSGHHRNRGIPERWGQLLDVGRRWQPDNPDPDPKGLIPPWMVCQVGPVFPLVREPVSHRSQGRGALGPASAESGSESILLALAYAQTDSDHALERALEESAA
jgi:hypothetical protein